MEMWIRVCRSAAYHKCLIKITLCPRVIIFPVQRNSLGTIAFSVHCCDAECGVVLFYQLCSGTRTYRTYICICIHKYIYICPSLLIWYRVSLRLFPWSTLVLYTNINQLHSLQPSFYSKIEFRGEHYPPPPFELVRDKIIRFKLLILGK